MKQLMKRTPAACSSVGCIHNLLYMRQTDNRKENAMNRNNRNNDQNFEFNQNDFAYTQTNETRDYSSNRRKKRRQARGRKIAGLMLSAVLFGGVAGGTAYSVNAGLSSTSSADATEETTIVASEASLLSTTASDSGSLDVSTIAASGLTSVVSVTNISVQQVESYFTMYGHGRMGNMGGETQTTESTSVGSGVIIYNDGSTLYMVTNYHVVEDATTLSVTFVDDTTYEATLCGTDEERDLAVLKVQVSDLTEETFGSISVAAIGSSDDLTVGEQVVAIGNALGYGQSVTTGIVSAKDRTVDSGTTENTYIQTDAAINPGNSGGALFNMNGELVGINTAKISTTDVEGMGYAIPISEVLDLISSMMY